MRPKPWLLALSGGLVLLGALFLTAGKLLNVGRADEEAREHTNSSATPTSPGVSATGEPAPATATDPDGGDPFAELREALARRQLGDHVRRLASTNPRLLVRLVLSNQDITLRCSVATHFCENTENGETLLEILAGSHESIIQLVVVERLGELQYVRALDLLEALARKHDITGQLFDRALTAIGRIQDQAGIALATEVLSSSLRPDLHVASAQFLGPRADEKLARWMLDFWRTRTVPGDPGANDFILKALSQADASILPGLASEFLTTERDPNKRNRLVFYMKGAQPDFALPFLAGIVQGSYEIPLKRQALIALLHVQDLRVGDIVLDLLRGAQTEEEAALIVTDGLGKLDRGTVDPNKLSRLYADAGNTKIKLALARALAAQADSSLGPEMVRSLREQALPVLGAERPSSVMTRLEVLVDIARLHPEGARDLLAAARRFSTDPAALVTISRGMAALQRNAEIMSALDALARHTDASRQVAPHAYKYIVRVGTEDEHRAVLRQLRDADDVKIEQIVKAFARHGDLAAVDRLREALRDLPDGVRASAQEILDLYATDR